ncbi:MAG: hypothetical protein V3T30_06035 [Thermodesulfobacteriota bacterium]
MNNEYLYVIGILLTFIVSLCNLWYNIRVARRTTYINTITSQRIKWIEQLRQDISTFNGLTHTWCRSNLKGTLREHEVLQEIDRLRHLIRLRLNPSGTHDKVIERLIYEIPDLTGKSLRKERQKAQDELTKTTQLLLKDEWDKVKDEANYTIWTLPFKKSHPNRQSPI